MAGVARLNGFNLGVNLGVLQGCRYPVTMPLDALNFAPEIAAIGGLTLGVAAVAKYCLSGRILGISGTIKGLFTGDVAGWRVAFTTGIIGSGFLALKFMPGAFDALPDSYTVSGLPWHAPS